MNPPVASSGNSAMADELQTYKATQAQQYRDAHATPKLSKFKEAQVEGLRPDSTHYSSKKIRANSVDQTAASRPRSTQPRPTSKSGLLQLLAADNRETRDTRRLLHTALAQLDSSSRRLAHSDAERRALESSQLAQTTATLQATSIAQQQAAAAQAELRLYKLQIEHAQQEIQRARDVVKTLEVQRDDAELAATRARNVARKLHTEKMAIIAKEQGRREGYETGFHHGQMIAAAKEQRRIEAEQRRRIAAPVDVSPPSGAFIEDHSSSDEEDVPRTLSRGVSDARRQSLIRRPRDSLESVRSIQQPSLQRIEAPPPHPITANNPPRRPASAMSSISTRRVSAPPAVAQHATRSRTTSLEGPRSNSRAERTSVVSETIPNRQSTSTPQHNRRNSTASRNSVTAPSVAPSAQHSRRRSTSTFELDSDLGLGSGPRPMPMDAIMPRVPLAPAPVMAPVMPQHIPMPPPPINVTVGAQPPLFPQPQRPQFEVERPERRDARSPSSASTSLRALHLTSFPPAPPTRSDTSSARERDPAVGMRMGREHGLSVILEDVDGSPGGSQLANGWENQLHQQGEAGPRGSSPYSDPRGVEEWRRGTDEEAPRHALPPQSPLTSPGMLSPYDTRTGPPHVSAHSSQESFRTDLRRSSSGSTVNITIVPPSRPASVGHSAGLTAQGSGGFLSPNHIQDIPVVPEEDEEDSEDDSEASFPVLDLGPLPAFARGAIDLPLGFVPQSISTGPQPLPPVRPSSRGGGIPGNTLNWGGPTPMGANPGGPLRPPSQLGRATPNWGAGVGVPPRPSSQMGGATGVNMSGPGQQPPRNPSQAAGSNWTFGESYNFGQRVTPGGQPPPSFPTPSVPSFPDPNAPSFPTPNVPSFRDPNAPSFPTPSVPSFHDPNAPSFPTPNVPSFRDPNAPSFPTPTVPSFHDPNAPSFPTPNVPSFRDPNAPSFPTPTVPSFHDPNAPSFPTPTVPSLHDPTAPSFPVPTIPSYPDPNAPSIRSSHDPSAPSFPVPTIPSYPDPNAPSIRTSHDPTAPSFPVPTIPSYPDPNAPSIRSSHDPNAPSFPVPTIPSYPQANPNAAPIRDPNAPSFPVPTVPSYPDPNAPTLRSSYDPNAPSFPVPTVPSYPDSSAPSFPAPSVPSYPDPNAPSFPVPAIPAFPDPTAPYFPVPTVPSFGAGNAPITMPTPTIPGTGGFTPRPQSYLATSTPRADNPALRPTTPRPIYAPALPGVSGAFGTAYPVPTPARAAAFPLPASVAATSSPATTTPHQRIASLNAGTTPAAFGMRPLAGAGNDTSFRPGSRASFARYNNNQTPNPNANFGITNPYTSTHGSGGSESSESSLGLDMTTATNTFVNANYHNGGPVIPVIPPSPAHSYRPLR